MRGILCITTALFSFWSIPVLANQQNEPCEMLVLSQPANFCVKDGSGVVIAGSRDRAQQLLDLGSSGFKRFSRYFGKTATSYAIVEIGAEGLSQTVRDNLRAAGINVILPWLSPDAYQAQIEGSIRRSVTSQIEKSGLTGSAREAAIEAAMKQALQRLPADRATRANNIAIPHELGHFWFINGYWPEAAGKSSGHYGGPGPDWLDEMAAVLMEPDESKMQRRLQFWDRYRAIQMTRKKQLDPKDELLNIIQYFSISHPVADAAQAVMQNNSGLANSGKTTVRILTGEEAKRVSGDGIRFYLQSLLVSDYLRARSKNEAIFGIISAAAGSKITFSDWLAKHGRRHGLPTTVEALQSDWLKWLEKV
jgi:hypothetical protein